MLCLVQLMLHFCAEHCEHAIMYVNARTLLSLPLVLNWKLSVNVRFMVFKIKKMTLNALNLIYCQFIIAQRIIIEDIGYIILEALNVFRSVYKNGVLNIEVRFPKMW